MPTPPLTARKPRETWSHARLAALVAGFGTKTGAHEYSPAETAKLRVLGLIAKPVPPALRKDDLLTISAAVEAVVGIAEPQRTLAIRATIARLREILPKRPKAGV
jgi:DNA-binding transcriptional LysR family regulator